MTAKRKALVVNALTIECEMLCLSVIGNHFPMQNITDFHMPFYYDNDVPKCFLLCFNVFHLGANYPLLILSTNSSGVKISILEKPNHFLPKSFIDAPM